MENIKEYNTFFESQRIQEISDINNVEILLQKLEDYLNLILHEIPWFRNNKWQYSKIKPSKEQINGTIITLTKYMNIIHNYYAKISHDIIQYNIDINYHFIDTMTTAIIILYSYIYNYNIYDVENHVIDEINHPSILIFFMRKIINNCYVIDYSIVDNDLLFKFKDVIYNKPPECRKSVETQTRLVVEFINKISVFYKIQPLNTRYVTMPKYTSICWFVSFIVSITYSDKNKKLLLDKLTENERNYKKDINISELTSNEIFTTLIYRIIKEITEDTKRYCDIDETSMNELNIYLKETPIQFLIKIVNEYYESQNKSRFPHEYSFIKDYIIDTVKNDKKEAMKQIAIQQGLYYDSRAIDYPDEPDDPDEPDKSYQLYKPYTIDEYEKLGTFGIQVHNYFFLNLLYRFLNINSLYLLKSPNEIFTYETTNTNPDVIIININTNKYACDRLMYNHVNSSKIAGYDIKYTDITSDIEYTPHKIRYNNNNYELDYILYGADIDNSWKKTGHSIVALNYNNDEYFYDSRYFIKEYNYNGKTLRYPCPLLKKEWKKDYYKKTNKFCIKKCFHTDINERSNLYRSTKDLSEDNICYTSNDDIICCYVKVSEEIAGEIRGGNKDYKITNNKVEFQYKNKKYIRNIYINTKKKYVKLNNQFILLSKLKKDLKNSY